MKVYLPFALALIANASASSEQTPALGSAVHAGEDSGKFSGSIEIPEFASEGEREAFLGAACTSIERLLGGTVECECTPQILSGTLSFDCDAFDDITIRERVIYTPSFNGVFSVALAALDVSFGAGYCLDAFSVFVEQVNTFLNLGDVCFSGSIKLDADLNSTTPLIRPTLASCTFTAGEFGECEVCEPCVTGDGQAGFSVTCSFVELAACVPLALPVSRSSRRVRPQFFGEQIVDGMLELAQPEIDRIISEAEETEDDDDDDEEPADVSDETFDEEPDETFDEEPDEAFDEEPVFDEEPDETILELPVDNTDSDNGDIDEDTVEEPTQVSPPDWGEPNQNTGRTPFWEKFWPF